jgi:hypothetical protein
MGQQPLSPINQKAVFTKNVMKAEIWRALYLVPHHGLRTPSEEIAFTALLKINSHSQMFKYAMVMAKAYFVCHIGPNLQISLIYAFIGCP